MGFGLGNQSIVECPVLLISLLTHFYCYFHSRLAILIEVLPLHFNISALQMHKFGLFIFNLSLN
jgi:hypothetical protein